MPYKKRPGRWFGKVCDKHPDLAGLRNPSGWCIKCNSERVVKYHQSERGKLKPSRVIRSRVRELSLRIKGWNAEDRAKISAIYETAQELRKAGQDVQVDHVVPLNGENVTGLHVSANLQIIPSTENHRKSNHYES